jgi:hypothetical protein
MQVKQVPVSSAGSLEDLPVGDTRSTLELRQDRIGWAAGESCNRRGRPKLQIYSLTYSPMRILTSSHYIARFTVPPQPEHSVARVRFVNMGRLWSPALAVAAWPPSRPFDLAHFINQIPLHLGKPWLVTFESALPRMFPPREPLHLHLRHQLCRPQCLSIVAMSAWAMANFKRLNAGWSGLKEALRKQQVRAPLTRGRPSTSFLSAITSPAKAALSPCAWPKWHWPNDCGYRSIWYLPR